MSTLGVSLLIFIVVAGMGMLLMQPVLASYAQNYLMRVRYNHPARSNKPLTKTSSLTDLCKNLGYFILGLLPSLKKTGMKQTLIEANFRSQDHFAILVGLKTLCSLFFGVLIATQCNIYLAPVAVFFAWTLPNSVVMGRAKKRKEKIFLELPAILDLIAVCSKAGLGLLASIDRVAKNLSETAPVMKEELDQALFDIKVFARPLRFALEDMSNRCGVEELSNLVSALMISDQKGANISATLQKQSLALRDRIKRKAEEKLSTAPVKMVPVIFVFILPLMFVPTLGPSVIQLMGTLGQMGSMKPP